MSDSQSQKEYEHDLNIDDSVKEEMNLNVKSNDKLQLKQNFGGFGDGTDVINTEEGIYDIMERDGGLKFTHDNRKPEDNTEEPAMYEEFPIELPPKLTSQREPKKPGRRRKTKKKKSKYPQDKHTMKQQIVGKIEENIYGKKKRKKLRKKNLKKNQMPRLTPEQEQELMYMIQQEQLAGMEENSDLDMPEAFSSVPRQQNKSEKEIAALLRKQKRKYKQSIQDYIEYLQKQEEAGYDRSKNARFLNERTKQKVMQIYQKKIQDELRNEEMSMNFKLRDEQANYMRFM